MSEPVVDFASAAGRAPGRRLFVGVPVATGVAEQLAGACESLARRAQLQGVALRWVAPATYHVTLKFLGWTRAEATPAILQALERAAAQVEPFRWKAARLGAFPSTGKATVVWAGAEDPGGLAPAGRQPAIAITPCILLRYCVRVAHQVHPHSNIIRLVRRARSRS